jgi:hypothetical protein
MRNATAGAARREPEATYSPRSGLVSLGDNGSALVLIGRNDRNGRSPGAPPAQVPTAACSAGSGEPAGAERYKVDCSRLSEPAWQPGIAVSTPWPAWGFPGLTEALKAHNRRREPDFSLWSRRPGAAGSGRTADEAAIRPVACLGDETQRPSAPNRTTLARTRDCSSRPPVLFATRLSSQPGAWRSGGETTAFTRGCRTNTLQTHPVGDKRRGMRDLGSASHSLLPHEAVVGRRPKPNPLCDSLRAQRQRVPVWFRPAGYRLGEPLVASWSK